MSIKKALIVGILALGMSSSSCLGPDNAYRSIKQWNANISDSDLVEELVFLGLTIIPVYPIALFCDIVIFNTITYWSGNDMINDPGQFTGFTKGD